MIAPFHVFGAFASHGSVVAALAIGLVFGWFLERGGLGNARKLAGQFYLTDLTVFRVLFTALVTAMLGVFWLTRAGILEPRLLDVPPTFLVPALVGGLVFGVGFVLGGLCPGTSCVSASSGRIDGMLVMVGMFFGVLTFMELHPLLEAFHNATGRGTSTLPFLVGLRPGLVVAGVTGAAVLAFVASERIAASGRRDRARGLLLTAALALGLGSALPWRDDAPWPGEEGPQEAVGSLDLARALRAGDTDLRVLDVRPAAAFEDFHLPLAESAPFDQLARSRLDPSRPILVYGFESDDGERARVLLQRRGFRRVEVLEGGALAWLREVMMPTLPEGAVPEERQRFSEIAELSRYFGGTPTYGRPTSSGLDIDEILGQARRASCGW